MNHSRPAYPMLCRLPSPAVEDYNKDILATVATRSGNTETGPDQALMELHTMLLAETGHCLLLWGEENRDPEKTLSKNKAIFHLELVLDLSPKQKERGYRTIRAPAIDPGGFRRRDFGPLDKEQPLPSYDSQKGTSDLMRGLAQLAETGEDLPREGALPEIRFQIGLSNQDPDQITESLRENSDCCYVIPASDEFLSQLDLIPKKLDTGLTPANPLGFLDKDHISAFSGFRFRLKSVSRPLLHDLPAVGVIPLWA